MALYGMQERLAFRSSLALRGNAALGHRGRHNASCCERSGCNGQSNRAPDLRSPEGDANSDREGRVCIERNPAQMKRGLRTPETPTGAALFARRPWTLLLFR